MKFLFDVGVGRSVEQHLSRQGFDVKTVRDIDPTMPDRQILDLAATEGRMVVTTDNNYGQGLW